jgi:hypothetical protein
MASRPRHLAPQTLRRLIVLGGLACAVPALAADPASSPDSQLRALSGSGAFRDADPATRATTAPIVRPDAVDAAGLSRAFAAGNRTAHQLTTPEEDDAGSIGGALLAIAGLVLAVVVIARFNSSRNS